MVHHDFGSSITPIKSAGEMQLSNTVFLIVLIKCRLVCACINYIHLYKIIFYIIYIYI